MANLLPAVVEASHSNIPMLLITADRPSEMRDSGANQTIDQVKIFGGYTRWAVDVPPPDHIVPVRGLLTTTDAAVRFATGNPAGPVHMNCQFREPLAPAVADWPQALLKVHHALISDILQHGTVSAALTSSSWLAVASAGCGGRPTVISIIQELLRPCVSLGPLVLLSEQC